MSKTTYKLIILALTIFLATQQVLLSQYGELNVQLQDALSKCAGITKNAFRRSI